MQQKFLAIATNLKKIAMVCSIITVTSNAAFAETPFDKYKPGGYAGQFLAANKALTSRDFASVVKFLTKLHTLQPNDLVVAESLFIAHLINGDFAKSVKFAKQSSKVKSHTFDTGASHFFLSKMLLSLEALKQNDIKKAVNLFIKGDDFMIAEMNYNTVSAWLEFAQDNPLKTAEKLNKLQDISFHKIYYLINNAIFAEMQDRQKDADSFYNKALDLGGSKLDLIEAYGRFLERTGREKQAFALYNNYEIRAGKHPLIAQARTRLIKGEKPEPFIKDSQAAIAYSLYHVASIYYGSGNYDESIKYARLGQYLEPDNKYLLNILSLNYKNLGKYLSSNTALRKIKQGSPFFGKAQIRIATNLEANEQKKLALETLKKLLETATVGDGTKVAYASMLSRDEQHDQAVEQYNEIVKQLKEPTINDANIYFARGVSNVALNHWEIAEIDFKKAIELNPNHSNALNYLGYSWIDMGINLDEGLEMINTALLVDPQNAFIIDSLGWAYYKLGKYDLARKELERALLVKPSNADINDHLGDAYWKLDRKLEAEFRWQQATLFKSDEINYEDLEYKREKGLDALDALKATRKTVVKS